MAILRVETGEGKRVNAPQQERTVSGQEFWSHVVTSGEKLKHVGGRVYAVVGENYVHSRIDHVGENNGS